MPSLSRVEDVFVSKCKVSECCLTLPCQTQVSCTLECELPPPHMRGVSGVNFSVVQSLFRSDMGRGALELFALCPCGPGTLQILLLCAIRAAGSSESPGSKVVNC